MKYEEYERTQLIITEFDCEDCIITSGEYGQDKYETRSILDHDTW